MSFLVKSECSPSESRNKRKVPAHDSQGRVHGFILKFATLNPLVESLFRGMKIPPCSDTPKYHAVSSISHFIITHSVKYSENSLLKIRMFDTSPSDIHHEAANVCHLQQAVSHHLVGFCLRCKEVNTSSRRKWLCSEKDPPKSK